MSDFKDRVGTLTCLAGSIERAHESELAQAKRELLDEVITNLKTNLDTKKTSWIQTTAELEVVVLDDAISLIEQMQQELMEG